MSHQSIFEVYFSPTQKSLGNFGGSFKLEIFYQMIQACTQAPLNATIHRPTEILQNAVNEDLYEALG